MNFGTLRAFFLKSASRPVCFLATFILLIAAMPNAGAIDDDEMRTLFAIGDIKDDQTGNVPVQAYIIFGNQLILADTFQVPTRLGGAVGLAVDHSNELLFMSYEYWSSSTSYPSEEAEVNAAAVGPGVKVNSDTIDVFSARTGQFISQITLAGTTNLAGMVVHQGRGHLYVVDRGDKDIWIFDTNNNFQQIDHWVLPTGSGAWGIDLHDDVLYVTDTDPLFSHYVRWYDIDTHVELGSYDFPDEVAGISVMTNFQSPADGPSIHVTSFDGGLGSLDTLQRYDIGSGQYYSITVAYHTTGISANPPQGWVYVSALGGSLLFPNPKIRVYSGTTGQLQNTYSLNGGWNPTDLVASAIPYGGTVSKTLVSHPGGVVGMGEQATFEIEILNQDDYNLVTIPLNDVYDTSHFTFVSATPAPNNPTNGDLVWNDLTTTLGDVAPNQSITVTVVLEATETCTEDLEGTNLAQVVNATLSNGSAMYAAGVADYTIACECSVSADCDDGEFCNGIETCNTVTGNCEPGDPPCEDDGLFCNGVEGCNEVTNVCTNTGDPCPDDGQFCNGDETCNESNDTCGHAGDPCPDDGQWCNGAESCNETTNTCDTTGYACPDDNLFCNGVYDCDEVKDECLDTVVDPCPDDGDYCNGDESCDEDADECLHSGDPCVDDGDFCNGDEVCNSETQSCESSGDPCVDDGEFCNGDEFCDAEFQDCSHSGDPCKSWETCDENFDLCKEDPDDVPDPGDDDTPDAGDDGGDVDQWPKGKVSGGCCGCD